VAIPCQPRAGGVSCRAGRAAWHEGRGQVRLQRLHRWPPPPTP
jgi:hypothetical protein